MATYYIKALDTTLLILYCAFIYYLSTQSSIPSPPLFEHLDKLLHAGAYFIMTAFALRAFRHVIFALPTLMMTSLVFISLYGISDEWHQSFVPGRDSDIADWLADTVGGVIFLGLYYWYNKRYCQQNSET